MQYIFLAVAIIGELIGTTLLKISDGFTKLAPSIGSLLAYGISFYFLSKALSKIPLSIAYATWSALGIIVTTLISIFIYREKLSIQGILGLVLVIVGVVILNLYGGISHT